MRSLWRGPRSGQVPSQQYFSPAATNQPWQAAAVYSSVVTGMLFIFAGLYGYKTYRVLAAISLSEHKRRKAKMFLYALVLYLLIFVGRTVWDVTYAVGVNSLQATFNDWAISGKVDERRGSLPALPAC